MSDDLLAPLAKKLCGDRDEAIKDRKSSGIEQVWSKAREQYAGIDEQNRDRLKSTLEKSETLDSPAYISSPVGKAGEESRSTVFVNITRPYTNAGTARVADILLPTGKMPWDLQLSPVSDTQLLRDTLAMYPETAQALTQIIPALTQDEETAKVAMENAKNILKDWLKETDWLNHVRTQITESGKVGTGVLKGPFPQKRKLSKNLQMALDMVPLTFGDNVEAGLALQKKLESLLTYLPSIECVKVENCYPAAGCGGDIQNGKYFFERVPEVSRRRLEDLMDDPTYLDSQVRACLEEGPKDHTGKKRKPTDGYDLWIRTGDVDLSDVIPALEKMEEETEESSCTFLTVVLCNGRVIKIAEPMLESKTFPYRMLLWEPREDHWAGIGIPEQIETPQRGLNAAVRSLMDNMGYSVGPQVLEIEDLIEPKDGDDYKMRPYKHWTVKPGLPGVSTDTDPSKAMTFLEFPNYLNEIMPVITYWLKMAEDTTGLPLLLQGQASTDAVGVSQQLMNNSTTNLRLIVKNWDDSVCKPNINDLYEWCQLYGPENAKGDATAVALGSSTLLVKELQMQALLQIGDRVLQPVYGISPQKWMQTFLEGFQIDFENLQMSEEERKQMEEASNQPDPRVVVAQIEAQGNVMIAQLKDATDKLKIYVDAQAKGASIEQARDAVETQAAANITQEAMKQDGAAAKAGLPARPQPQPEVPEMDIDAALGTLGLQ
jgi:hypothetical protein